MLSLGVIMGCAAISIDYGRLLVLRAELRNASEAAAYGAVTELGDAGEVTRVAIYVAGLNTAGGHPVTVAPEDVRIGTYDVETRTWADDADGDFVRVDTGRIDEPLLFAWALGWSSADIGTRSIAGSVSVGGWAGPCLLFADEAITLSGTGFIDGYDSTVGYEDSHDSTGVVCSNIEDVDTQGTIEIYGDVHPGPDGDVEVGGSSYVSGDTTAMNEEVELDAITVPGGTTALPAAFAKVKPSQTLALEGGKYTYSGAIDLKGTVNTDDPVEIYVDGDVTINGQGFVNASENPHNLKIYVIGEHTVKVNGGADFFGVIYAPDSEVTLNGSSAYYGSAVGNTVKVNGTGDVHLDTSLLDDTPEGTTGGRRKARLYE